MAGSVSAATLLAIGGLAVAGVGTGAAIYSGMKSDGNQQAALKNQTTATQTAESASLSTQRKNELSSNAANSKVPDVSDIMARAAQASKMGGGSTMLTGTGGVGPGSLSLGKNTLLGS